MSTCSPHSSVSPLTTPLESVLCAIPNLLSTEMVSSCNSPMLSHLVMLKDSPISQAFAKPSPPLQHLPAQLCQEGSIFPTLPLLRGGSSQALAVKVLPRTIFSMKEQKQQSLNKGAKVDWKCQVINMMFYKVTMVIFYAFPCSMNADDEKHSWAN